MFTNAHSEASDWSVAFFLNISHLFQEKRPKIYIPENVPMVAFITSFTLNDFLNFFLRNEVIYDLN